MKLTADVINKARTYYNPLKERELDLRGLRISTIENLGSAKVYNYINRTNLIQLIFQIMQFLN